MPPEIDARVVYTCPVHGAFPMPVPVTRDAIVGWWEDMEARHGQCGQPSEPPCPVKHTKHGYFTSGPTSHPLLERYAVAIAFQAAVERGLITIGRRTWFDGVTRNYYQAGDLCFDSIHAAVQAIWPITFAELEAP